MTKTKAWILAARPKTLTASVLPILATTGMVYGLQHVIQWWIVACALFSSFCIQIGTNFVNDAMDFKKGADTEGRLGPMRVTQQGHFTFKQVMFMATAFFVLAIALGIPLVIHGGWPIVVIGLVSVLMGYAYTSGPYPLAYHGLGDLFVILFFGLVAVCGFYYLLTLEITMDAVVLGFQVGFLNTILIAINNLRDIDGDRLVNKKTLAVRLGKTGGRIWIGFLIVAPFVMGYYWLNLQLWYVYAAPLICFPLGLSIAKKIFRNEPGVIYNKFLAQSAAYGLLFCILIAIGFQIK
ncbi:MAG: 1,4-dihydroxy-2-naphthoate octaprenyltransferase [Pseudobdellovibrio sp.]